MSGQFKLIFIILLTALIIGGFALNPFAGGGFLGMTIFGILGVYNKLVAYTNAISEFEGNIQSGLTRRSELLNRLLDILTSTANIEASILNDVARIRTALSGDHSGEAYSSLIAVAEATPEVQTSENFLKLQDDLFQVEQYILDKREHYNAAVRVFNITLKQFPNIAFAAFLTFREKTFYSDNAKAAERTLVNLEKDK